MFWASLSYSWGDPHQGQSEQKALSGAQNACSGWMATWRGAAGQRAQGQDSACFGRSSDHSAGPGPMSAPSGKSCVQREEARGRSSECG